MLKLNDVIAALALIVLAAAAVVFTVGLSKRNRKMMNVGTLMVSLFIILELGRRFLLR